MTLYCLFEHAAGYAIFKVHSTEEIGALLPEVQESVTDLERFGRIVKLVAFSPFKTAANALENINSISEGNQFVIDSRFNKYNFTQIKLQNWIFFNIDAFFYRSGP